MEKNTSPFQIALEAVTSARTCGQVSADECRTPLSMDDQDCYPRGIILNIGRSDPIWKALLFLSKNLNWINLEARRKLLNIAPTRPFATRAAECEFLYTASRTLAEHGISCAVDIYYR